MTPLRAAAAAEGAEKGVDLMEEDACDAARA